MFKTRKIYFLLLLLPIILLISKRDYLHRVEPDNSDSAKLEILPSPIEESQPESFQLIADQDEQNAWDLLQANAQVNFTEYDFGIFIEGINGLMSDESHFWSLYLNGESASVGIKDITLNKDDMIEFKYEAIE